MCLTPSLEEWLLFLILQLLKSPSMSRRREQHGPYRMPRVKPAFQLAFILLTWSNASKMDLSWTSLVNHNLLGNSIVDVHKIREKDDRRCKAGESEVCFVLR
uniref:Uncharacterized protein n=1 Tax=Nelumbo nucifera TaxID=4432 RepID=A0A822ZBI5_NELNU|nr:TPA_asm: hypothetical protein HUJ06_015334 [Nelumbo nucifera]